MEPTESRKIYIYLPFTPEVFIKSYFTFQRQTQQDWANREYIELIAGSIKRIADFLNSFDMSCRSRLSNLNEKLTTLERKVDFLEAKVSRGGETPT